MNLRILSNLVYWFFEKLLFVEFPAFFDFREFWILCSLMIDTVKFPELNCSYVELLGIRFERLEMFSQACCGKMKLT